MALALRNALRMVGPSLRLIRRSPLAPAVTKLELCQRAMYHQPAKFTTSVLENPDIKQAFMQVSTLVYEDEEAFSVYQDVLTAPRPADKAPLNENLKRKLAYRLGRVLLSLKRLTFALENHLLNDSEKYDVLVRTLLKEVDKEQLDLDDETVQSLFSYYDDDGSADDEEAESIPNNYSYLLRRNRNAPGDEKWASLDAMLVRKSRRVEAADVEFGEDLLASIESEIRAETEQLAEDFPDIETHVHRLKLGALKQWLSEYNDEMLHQPGAADSNYLFDENSPDK